MINIINVVKASLMGVVEGLTEFVPISSTGHLILTSWLINFNGDNVKVFEIAIQTGAMLAVVWQYRNILFDTLSGLFTDSYSRQFSLKIIIAFLPAVGFGLALGSFIQSHLFNPFVVSIAFISGGLIILLVEKHKKNFPTGEIDSIGDLSKRKALAVGLLQCLALIPGMSRSGSTIIGGMVLGLSRKCATEFSFFLGIPTLMGAGFYSVLKSHNNFTHSDVYLLAAGLIFSFISALVCIRWLIKFVSTHTFVFFAWYRILFGVIVLLTGTLGLIAWDA